MKLHIEELSLEAFASFGSFHPMINPQTPKIGASPIEFFRDMGQLELGTSHSPSFSVCRVIPRPAVVDVTEYHSHTGEAMLPLDGEILIHVGPATPPNAAVPLEEFRIFRVPVGTLILLRPGVWHHAPFAIGDKAVNVLIVLPERTYANDTVVVELGPQERLEVG